MQALVINNDNKQILDKFVQIGKEQFHLDIKILDNIQLQNIKLVEKPEKQNSKKKSKWAKIADEIRGTMDDKTAKYLEQCSKEFREGFELKDLSVSK